MLDHGGRDGCNGALSEPTPLFNIGDLSLIFVVACFCLVRADDKCALTKGRTNKDDGKGECERLRDGGWSGKLAMEDKGEKV